MNVMIEKPSLGTPVARKGVISSISMKYGVGE
jgi:hypothetical protein